MRIFFSFGIVLIFLLQSCNKVQTPQVVYDGTRSDTLTIDNLLEDTTKVLVTAMPVYLDSTDVLIHPIGWDDIYMKNKMGYSSGSVTIDSKLGRSKMVESDYGFEVNSNERDYIYGNMVNLIFENIETGQQHILTDKVLVVREVKYLRELAKKTDKHYLLYTVYDKDYNRDGKLDVEDMIAYYMSNLDGTNFTKITQDYHYLDISKLILRNGRYYFRTLEDVNKDGKFNKRDKYHYYYIDLKKGDFTPVEYFPIELMNVE